MWKTLPPKPPCQGDLSLNYPPDKGGLGTTNIGFLHSLFCATEVALPTMMQRSQSKIFYCPTIITAVLNSDIVENHGNTPQHIVLIMDGNGRWAKAHGLPRVSGHRQGVESIKKLLPACGRRGIPYLTLFAFSSENWQRPSAEVSLLFELLTSTLKNEIQNLHKHQVRLRIIGDLSKLPQRLQKSIADADKLTTNNTALNLTIAINYGGKWDLLEACKSVATRVEKGEFSSASITHELFESQLCTHDLPEPDLFIRTGGEQRISNFLLWQLAYTELYFTDTYWPDFDESHLDIALQAFARRQRRFGKTNAQVQSIK